MSNELHIDQIFRLLSVGYPFPEYLATAQADQLRSALQNGGNDVMLLETPFAVPDTLSDEEIERLQAELETGGVEGMVTRKNFKTIWVVFAKQLRDDLTKGRGRGMVAIMGGEENVHKFFDL